MAGSIPPRGPRACRAGEPRAGSRGNDTLLPVTMAISQPRPAPAPPPPGPAPRRFGSPRRLAATWRFAAAVWAQIRRRRAEPRLTVGVDINSLFERLTGVGWYLTQLLDELAGGGRR